MAIKIKGKGRLRVGGCAVENEAGLWKAFSALAGGEWRSG
jgi:hypothetical protein